MPGPDAHRLATRRAHARGDEVERLVPRRLAPGVGPRRGERGPAGAAAAGVADDLARGLAAHAEKALAVGIVGVAPHADEPAVLDLDQHAAEGRVAVHRAHRADDAQAGRGGRGHGAIIPAEAAARHARPRRRARGLDRLRHVHLEAGRHRCESILQVAHECQVDANPALAARAGAIGLPEAVEHVGSSAGSECLAGVAHGDLGVRAGPGQADVDATALLGET